MQATFFLMGQHAEQFPNLVKRIYKEGHEIGNHSYSHPRFVSKSLDFIRQEIESTDAIIRNLGYTKRIHFRAPYGKKRVRLPWFLYKSRRPHILFDVTPGDWTNPGVNVIVKRVVNQVKPGSIILFHDGCEDDLLKKDKSQTVKAVPDIICAFTQMDIVL